MVEQALWPLSQRKILEGANYNWPKTVKVTVLETHLGFVKLGKGQLSSFPSLWPRRRCEA